MDPADRSRLRPELRAFLEAFDLQAVAEAREPSPAEARAAAEVEIPALWGPVEAVARIDDLTIRAGSPTLRARLYRPRDARGTVMFIHGGGWVVGSLDTHDGSCRRLANAVPCDILSVDYRKAPEHPFPAGLDDVRAGLTWLLEHGADLGLDTRSMVLAGESAGGNLAAVLARHAREARVALGGQLLIQPATDLAMATESYRDLAVGFRVTADGMARSIAQYVPGVAVRSDPDASPLRARDLSRLAPALILTAEFDPLRDDGRAYASRLIEAGNDVSYVECKGSIHSIWVMNAITPVAAEVIAGAADWIRCRWGDRPPAARSQ
jgi:acetyl esterase